jgi:hypothetical protein
MLPDRGKVVTLGYAVAVATIYVVLLLVTRELTGKDANTVKAVIRRKR